MFSSSLLRLVPLLLPPDVCAPKPSCRGRVPGRPDSFAPLGVVDLVTPLVTFWMFPLSSSSSEFPHKTKTRNTHERRIIQAGSTRADTQTNTQHAHNRTAARELLRHRKLGVNKVTTMNLPDVQCILPSLTTNLSHSLIGI